jgi:hypothetical protein
MRTPSRGSRASTQVSDGSASATGEPHRAAACSWRKRRCPAESRTRCSPAGHARASARVRACKPKGSSAEPLASLSAVASSPSFHKASVAPNRLHQARLGRSPALFGRRSRTTPPMGRMVILTTGVPNVTEPTYRLRRCPESARSVQCDLCGCVIHVCQKMKDGFAGRFSRGR